jgi:hypothetical protein
MYTYSSDASNATPSMPVWKEVVIVGGRKVRSAAVSPVHRVMHSHRTTPQPRHHITQEHQKNESVDRRDVREPDGHNWVICNEYAGVFSVF